VENDDDLAPEGQLISFRCALINRNNIKSSNDLW